MGPSDTLSLKENLRDLPIFIIHGSADNNVPVKQAKMMIAELEKFHKDFVFREFPGKGHWWNDKFAAGADCVDLPDLFDFFARRRRPAAPYRIHFRTYNPQVASEHRWIRVLGQDRQHALSEVEAEARPGSGRGEPGPEFGRIEVRTKNVSSLGIHPARFFGPGKLTVAIDGTDLGLPAWQEGGPWLSFRKEEGRWTAGSPDPAFKSPGRYGPFKMAFTRRFVMVYGTGGTGEENRAVLSRLRFDLGVWWYRANGWARVLPDTAYDPARHEGNVILYGHADMNSAFAKVLDSGAFHLGRGVIRVGGKTLRGKSLSCLALRPLKGSAQRAVGIVGGTGPAGIRMSLLASYFRSGIQYPDLTVWGGESGEGRPGGIRATGFFGRDWTVSAGGWWFSDGWQDGESGGAEEKKEEEDF
jgi:hypothetical protein